MGAAERRSQPVTAGRTFARAPGVDRRDGAGRPAALLALQRSVGNRAVRALLPAAPAPAVPVVQRAPTVDSMDAAWGELTARVPGANVFSFIVRLRRSGTLDDGTLDDGGRGFSWADFLAIMRDDRGKRWIKAKWRDIPGKVWGDQTISGQHEWIKTDDVNYVIYTVVESHAGADLDAWLAACEILRIPTADVAFQPTIDAAQVKDANANPGAHTARTLGEFSGHVGAYYEPRTTPAKKPQHTYRPVLTGEKGTFHTPLHELLLRHLNTGTNDLQGFLTALQTFQTDKLWGGEIEDLTTADQIPNDYRGGQGQAAPLRGRHTSSYDERTGITTAYEPARTVADLQSFANEAKARNAQIMSNRINALLRQWLSSNIPHVPSTVRPATGTEENYTVDPSGKSVEDYDRELGYDAATLTANPHGVDTDATEDMEADETYMPAPVRPTPPTSTEHSPMPQAVLQEFGQARSAVTTEFEQHLGRITAEVQRLFSGAFHAEIRVVEDALASALAALDPSGATTATRQADLRSAAAQERQAIQQRYDAEARRQFTTYIDAKRQLDGWLYEQETRQTTTAALQTLLETYFARATQLLDSYADDIRSILRS